MSKFKYYPRYARDFLEGTIGMPLEVKGAYSILLDLIYVRDGRLPDDPHFICGHLGCSVRKWNMIKPVLIEAGKIVVRDGFITNSRADKVVRATRLSPDYPEIISTKSGDNLEINRATSAKNNDLQAPLSQSQSQSQNISTVVDKLQRLGAADDWPEKPMHEVARDLCQIVGSGMLDIDKSQGLVTSSGRLARWKSDGLSWSGVVVPVVSSLAGRAKRAIGQWGYFDGALAEAHQQASREMPVVTGGNANGNADRETGRSAWGEIIGERVASRSGQDEGQGRTGAGVRGLPIPDRANQD